MAKKHTTEAEVTDVIKVEQGRFEVCVVGTSPIIMNRMSQKAWRQLISPSGRKTAAEKATTVKHDPVAEFRASAYTFSDPAKATFLGVLSTAFKGALCTAALDMPGAKKSQIGRLTWVTGDYVGVYGVPRLFMAVVRSADMARTPDIRTRAILPQWAARVGINYTKPLIRPQAVANLLAAAGMTVGVGDWRPEKGKGNYGQFRLTDEHDPEYLAILEAGGREEQKAALETPVCYDDESAEMLEWYDEEMARRKLKGVVAA